MQDITFSQLIKFFPTLHANITHQHGPEYVDAGERMVFEFNASDGNDAPPMPMVYVDHAQFFDLMNHMVFLHRFQWEYAHARGNDSDNVVRTTPSGDLFDLYANG